ncbi:hypothetical protein [Salinirarus marinus]|uniref:hypothetical protein n=1 Tax=Salinirarus marinus TaxID=3068310 RepID=UPI003C6C7B63
MWFAAEEAVRGDADALVRQDLSHVAFLEHVGDDADAEFLLREEVTDCVRGPDAAFVGDLRDALPLRAAFASLSTFETTRFSHPVSAPKFSQPSMRQRSTSAWMRSRDCSSVRCSIVPSGPSAWTHGGNTTESIVLAAV